jgi:hypothetical protein
MGNFEKRIGVLESRNPTSRKYGVFANLHHQIGRGPDIWQCRIQDHDLYTSSSAEAENMAEGLKKMETLLEPFNFPITVYLTRTPLESDRKREISDFLDDLLFHLPGKGKDCWTRERPGGMIGEN